MQLYIKAGREYIPVEKTEMNYSDELLIFLSSKEDLIRAAGLKILDGLSKDGYEGDGSRFVRFKVKSEAKEFLVFDEPKPADRPCSHCGKVLYADELRYIGLSESGNQYGSVCKECGEIADAKTIVCPYCAEEVVAKDAVVLGWKYNNKLGAMAYNVGFHACCAALRRGELDEEANIQKLAEGESGQATED